MVYCGSGTETKTGVEIISLYGILWSTAEAVLRRIISNIHHDFVMDPMVYCGSGTETSKKLFHNCFCDPMVYCGSGTETLYNSSHNFIFLILWSTAEAVLRHFLSYEKKLIN